MSQTQHRFARRLAAAAAGALVVPLLSGGGPAVGGLVKPPESYLGEGSGALSAANGRGDVAVAFVREGHTYVRTRPVGGRWGPARGVAEDAEVVDLTIDGEGRPTVFWLGERLWVRRLEEGGWTPRRALSGSNAGSHLVADQNGAGALAAVYLGDDGVTFAYRNSSGRWRSPQVLFRRSVQPLSLELGIDRAGHATVVWVQARGGEDVLHGVRTGVRGRAGTPVVLSPAVGSADYDPDLDVNAAGDVAVVWWQDESMLPGGSPVDGAALLRTRSAHGGWADPERLSIDRALEPQVALAPDGGVWVAGRVRTGSPDGFVVLSMRRSVGGAWRGPTPLTDSREGLASVDVAGSGAGAAVTFYDGAGQQLWVSHASSIAEDFLPPQTVPHADSGYSVSASGTGDLLMTVLSRWRPTTVSALGPDPDPRRYVYALAYDAAGPVTRVTRPLSPFTRGRDLRLAWRARDSWSQPASYRLRGLEWAPDGSGRRLFVTRDVDGTVAEDLRGTRGRTYCFDVRATDTEGNVGPWSSRRCTAVPLNDRELLRGGGWVEARSPGSYNDDVLRSRTKGATVSTEVSTRRVALLATRCPGCGNVEVRLGRRLLRAIALDSTAVRRQVRIPVARFSSPQRGRLRVVVTTSGRPVEVDGIATSSR